MTPSNPTNQQPLIYRIADALGVFHLVAPVNHTHSQAEIDGLESALAGKADKNKLGNDETFVQIDNDTLRLSGSQKIVLGIFDPDDEFVEIRNDNIQNLRRALTNPDSTPTASSNNLVTSGGVKTALDGKANASDVQAALAAKMSNTALSLEVEYHMTSHQVNYYDGASSIFTSVQENKIAVAMLYFFSNEGHNPLGNTLVQLRWYNSVNNVYKHIEIFINGAVYNLRYKVETEEWREMVQTAASITQYLPTSAE